MAEAFFFGVVFLAAAVFFGVLLVVFLAALLAHFFPADLVHFLVFLQLFAHLVVFLTALEAEAFLV